MSTDPTSAAAGPSGPAGAPSEDELRAAYEAELSRITTTDMLAQTAVSLLNLGARRLGPPPPQPGDPAAPQTGAGAPERDLEQVRDAIDGARALLEILERRIPQEVRPLRDALSQLQMAYAREIQAAPAAQASSAQTPAAAQSAPGAGASDAAAPPAQTGVAPKGAEGDGTQQPPGPGPAESSGRLWVPGR